MEGWRGFDGMKGIGNVNACELQHAQKKLVSPRDCHVWHGLVQKTTTVGSRATTIPTAGAASHFPVLVP